MSLLMDLLLVSTAWSHVLLTPFTKVEESFNLHATHDVLMYGLDASNLSKYDHFVFPGAVPRSFLGNILLAWCSLPVIHLLNAFDAISTKADILIVVRLVLATLNGLGLCILRRAVSKRLGVTTSAFFTVLSCSQFHLPFWMGRTLPNMYALLPVNIAYAYILARMPNSTRPTPQNVRKAISLLTFTSVVLRAEILLLLCPLVLQSLLARWSPFWVTVRSTLIAAFASIALTTLLDSYFWQRWPLWPELYSLYFNVYQNKSKEWGVSPFHAYFTTHLPKLLLTSAPLAALGLLVESRIRSLLVSPIIFVALISCLAHKEWRFIVYVVPLFNVAAARGAYWMSRQRTRTILGRFSLFLVLACIVTNVLITFIMTQVSMANYPGGLALTRFNELFNGTPNVHVHIDNLAAQTGASLFLQVHSPPPPYPPSLPQSPHSPMNWVYNKTEHLTPSDITSTSHFTHAITEHASSFPSSAWTTIECVKGFDGFRVSRRRRRRGAHQAGGDGEGGGGGIWEKIPKLNIAIAYADKLCILIRR